MKRLFAVLYIAFLWPLFTFEQGFIRHDYGVQCYPWMALYRDALLRGALPFWTPLIQSGFPLFAEGQTGALYGLNWLLYRFFSLNVAYNLMFLIHFLMGAFFMYLFSAKKKLSAEASALVVLAFVFGSAYAGCSNSVIAMRSLVWFPLMLYCVELHFSGKKIFAWTILALIQGQTWLSGSPQTAFYAALFEGIYFLIRLREEKIRCVDAIKSCLGFGAALCVSLLIGLPQVWATWELASHSTRSLYSPEFALWGSAAPWSLLSLFMYSWVFLKSPMYIGLWPLLSVFFLFREPKRRVWWLMAVISFLLALGKFNPLYWLILNIPLVSVLRNPSKFLFFTSFALTMLAALGLDALMREIAAGRKHKIEYFLKKITPWIFGLFLLAITVWAISHFGSGLLKSYGQWYVEQFVVGKNYHKYSMDSYVLRIESILSEIRRETSLLNPFFWWPFVLALGFIGSLKLAIKKRIKSSSFKILFLSVLVLDLFIYGKSEYGAGFVGHIRPFPDLAQARSYELDGRWLDLTGDSESVFMPNRNILTGQKQVGAYSPLVDSRFYLLMKDLGVIDDSLGREPVNWETLEKARPLLNFLGINYFLGPSKLFLRGLEPLRKDNGGVVYRNREALGEFSLIFNERLIPEQKNSLDYLKSENFKPQEEVVLPAARLAKEASGMKSGEIQIEEQSIDQVTLSTRTASEAILVRNQVYDSGWRAHIDGAPTPVFSANLAFQGILVPQGEHRIVLSYEPDFWRVGKNIYVVSLVLTLLLAIFFWRKENLAP